MNNWHRAGLVFDAIEDAIIMISPEWAIESCNRSLLALLGYAREELDGRSAEVLFKDHALAAEFMNCYQFFSSEINLRSQERLSLQIRLRKGLDSNELVVHYQPQVDSITGRVVGVEALVRWSDPEKGVIAPDQFIPLAEETGLIHEIGEFVLRAALGQARKWRKERLPPYPGTLFLQAAAAGKPAVFHPRPREMRPAQRRERNE